MRCLVEAIVPRSCLVRATSVEQGWHVSLVICGRLSCRTVDLQPPMNRTKLLAIAEAWEDGDYKPPAGTLERLDTTHWLRSVDDLTAWLRAAKPGARAAYFDGSLVHFRADSGKKLRLMQSQADRRNGKTKHWAKKVGEFERLQALVDMLAWIERLRAASSIELVQQRKPNGTGAVYFVVKK